MVEKTAMVERKQSKLTVIAVAKESITQYSL